jgi:hypothetical protein
MVGGLPGGYAGDTWHFNGVSWVQASASVAGIYEHKLVDDPVAQSLHMLGGTEYISGNAWKHRVLVGGQWQSVLTSAGLPWARDPVACWDSARQVVMMLYQGNTWIYGPSPIVASATSYGVGCGVPPLVFTPDLTYRPIIGAVGKAQLPAPPTLLGGCAMGWSNTSYGSFALPAPLISVGMGTCLLLQSADVLGLPLTALPGAGLEYTCSVPNQAALVGAHVYIQAYCISPGANQLQVVVSNGIDWRIGNQ